MRQEVILYSLDRRRGLPVRRRCAATLLSLSFPPSGIPLYLAGTTLLVIGVPMVRVVLVVIAGNLTRLCPSSLSWSLRQCLLILFCEVCRSYLKKGLTIWLNVPLDALARRIAAVVQRHYPSCINNLVIHMQR